MAVVHLAVVASVKKVAVQIRFASYAFIQSFLNHRKTLYQIIDLRRARRYYLEKTRGMLMKRNKIANIIIIAAIFIGVTLYFIISGGDTMILDFEESTLTIHGVSDFTETVQYSEIESAELMDIPELGVMAEGYTKGQYSCGTWENEQYGSYRLFITDKATNCIKLKLTDGRIIVFNYIQSYHTQEVHEMMLEFLD